jgi:hypothetical protein
MQAQQEMAKLNYGARMQGIAIQEGNLELNQQKFNTPETTTKTDEFGEKTTSIKTRGGSSAPAPMAKATAPAKAARPFVYSPKINVRR